MTTPELPDSNPEAPVSAQRIDELRRRYYPRLRDEDIRTIEEVMRSTYEEFCRTGPWVTRGDKQPQLSLEVTDALEQRIEEARQLFEDRALTFTFASLDRIEAHLVIEGHKSLRKIIESNPDIKSVVDLGCGGQVADIELAHLFGEQRQDFEVHGVGAFDYAGKLRAQFPEFDSRLFFHQANLLEPLVSITGDVVFSARTAKFTGVVDPVRFCRIAHDTLNEDGIAIIGDIKSDNFVNLQKPQETLGVQLDRMSRIMPSLRYEQAGNLYVLSWTKRDGFPFRDYVASAIDVENVFPDIYTKCSVRYKLKDSN